MKQEGHWAKFGAAIQELLRLEAYGTQLSPEGKSMCGFMARFIEKSPRFYVPDASAVLKDPPTIADDIRLPYPAIAILSEVDAYDPALDSPEISIERVGGTSYIGAATLTGPSLPSWKITVAMQPFNDARILLWSIAQEPKSKRWACAPVTVVMNKDYHTGLYGMSFGGDPATSDVLKILQGAVTAPQLLQEFLPDLTTVFTLWKLLGVHDAKQIPVPAPPKLQARRAKSNGSKPRLYDYHVLSIGGEVWDSPHEHTGTGEGTRSHLRRGHIRRLETKNIWVRSTYVHGSKEGFVQKDYEVKGTSGAP